MYCTSGACFFVLVVLFAAGYLYVNRAIFFNPALYEWGDLAANALQIENAKRFRETLGPYSRLGFHHPGPILFYFYGGMEDILNIFPSLHARHLFSQFLLNLFMLSVLCVCVIRQMSLARCTLLFVCVIWSVGSIPQFYSTSPLSGLWGPYVVVVPVTIYIFFISRIPLGDLRYLPWAAIAAVMAIHAHIGTLVVVGGLGAMAVALLGADAILRRNETPYISRRRIILTIFIISIGLVPIVIDHFSADESNLDKIYRFMNWSAGGGQRLEDAIRVISKVVTQPIANILGLTRDVANSTIFLVVSLSFMLLGSTVWAFRNDSRGRLWVVFCWLAILLSVYSAVRVKGKLADYIFFYGYGISGSLLYFTLDSIIEVSSRQLRILPRLVRSIAPMLVFSMVLAIWLTQHTIEYPHTATRFEDLERNIVSHGDENVVIHVQKHGVDHGLWPEAVTFALMLERGGRDVRVSHGWRFMYGEHYRATGEEDSLILFTKSESADEMSSVRIRDYHVIRIPRSMWIRACDNERSSRRQHPMNTYIRPSDATSEELSWSQGGDIWSWNDRPSGTVLFAPDAKTGAHNNYSLKVSAGASDRQIVLVFANRVFCGSFAVDSNVSNDYAQILPSYAVSDAYGNEVVFIYPNARLADAVDDEVMPLRIDKVGLFTW